MTDRIGRTQGGGGKGGMPPLELRAITLLKSESEK